MEALFFYVFGAGTVVFALLVVTRKNVIHAALFLVLTFFFVAGIYVLLNAEFLAAVQVLIYAGGIMVLYLFTVMLMNVDVAGRLRQWHRQGPLALLVTGLLGAEFLVVLATVQVSPVGEPFPPAGTTPPTGGNVEAFGSLLYTKFLFPFEVASMLLLAAMIGAIVLAKRDIER